VNINDGTWRVPRENTKTGMEWPRISLWICASTVQGIGALTGQAKQVVRGAFRHGSTMVT